MLDWFVDIIKHDPSLKTNKGIIESFSKEILEVRVNHSGLSTYEVLLNKCLYFINHNTESYLSSCYDLIMPLDDYVSLQDVDYLPKEIHFADKKVKYDLILVTFLNEVIKSSCSNKEDVINKILQSGQLQSKGITLFCNAVTYKLNSNILSKLYIMVKNSNSTQDEKIQTSLNILKQERIDDYHFILLEKCAVLSFSNAGSSSLFQPLLPTQTQQGQYQQAIAKPTISNTIF